MFGIFKGPRDTTRTHIEDIKKCDPLLLNLDGTIRAKIDSLSDREVEILWNQFKQFVDSEGVITNPYSVFQDIITPLLGLNPNSLVYVMHISSIIQTFIRIIQSRLHDINTKGGAILINEEYIKRIANIGGYEMILCHIEESNNLMLSGFTSVAYSELMKSFEKLLKKVCLLYHREDYQKQFNETPINAKMEDIVKFLRKLGWNDRQYIKPIEDLNKFANDDKHAINHRGNIRQVEQHDYKGVIAFIIDWIESHK